MRAHRLIVVISLLCFCGELGAQTGNQEFRKTRLGYWRFNHKDVRGERGQRPLAETNFVTVVSTNYDGTALRISETDPPVALRYRVVELDGRTNLDSHTGGIRLRYKPVWDGPGPGHWARLIEIGDFALSIDPSGQILSFQSSAPNGGVVTNVEARVASYLGTSKGARLWMDIAIGYSPFGTTLMVNGNKIAAGTGVIRPPSEALQRNGFSVGSSAAGDLRAVGLIDDLETLNYPPGQLEWYRSQMTLSASVTGDPPSVHLVWEDVPNRALDIQRREINSINWTELATNFYGNEFVDASPQLTPGHRYVYRASTNIVIGVNDVAVEYRGRVILLVDQTVANPLAAELSRLQSDLLGDGWTVIRHDVPRHDDVTKTNNIARVAGIRSLVVADYNADPTNTKTLFVVGHVAIPYSGPSGPDGHGMRPFPTDIYYGDADGIWTDVQEQPRVTNPMWLNNDPGDGIFDQTTIPTNSAGIRRLEIPSGRVDFARLPAFSSGSGPFPKKTEIDLLRQYLNKDHRYRHGQIDLRRRVIAAGFLPPQMEGVNQLIFQNALRNGSRWYGSEPDSMLVADMFLAATPAQWAFAAGFGSGTQIAWYSVTNLPDPGREPPVNFYMMDGSYFGDWNTDDNLLRSLLATPKYGLASMWSRTISWRLEELALGEPLSSGILATANDPSQFPQRTPIYLTVMGDPTLRLEVTAPPSNPKAVRRGRKVQLNWVASPAANPSYDVFRRLQGVEGPFQRLNTGPIADVSYTDSAPPSGTKLYLVRTRALVHTGSGSYTNLSQGIFVTIK